MDRQTALQILHEALPGLRVRFGVTDLALFGSVARNEAGPDSDIDVMVSFRGPATFDGFMDLEETLANLLGRNVDLVTEKAIKPRMRSSIEKDLIHVR